MVGGVHPAMGVLEDLRFCCALIFYIFDTVRVHWVFNNF